MGRYHIYKLGLAVFFSLVYLARIAVIDGLRLDDLMQNATDNRERRDAVVDAAFHKSASDGTPGVDFPNLAYIPKTRFNCRDMETGYYADLETDCQVFHICDEGRKISFLCPNGTIFQQSELICDWWFKVNCTTSPLLYEESAETLVRENVKRKESRRVSNKESRKTIFSSGENYQEGTSKRTTPLHFITPSYRDQFNNRKFTSTTDNSVQIRRGDRRLDYDQVTTSKYNNINNSRKQVANNYQNKSYQETASNDFNVRSSTIKTTSRSFYEQSQLNSYKNPIRNKTNSQSKTNFISNSNHQSHRLGNSENQREVSEESQELQETASFVKNYRNNAAINNKQIDSNLYPNHRQTYSEIKDPRYYIEKSYSKLPSKPFYGSYATQKILSTIPVANTKTSTQNYYNLEKYTALSNSSQISNSVTERDYSNTVSESVQHFPSHNNLFNISNNDGPLLNRNEFVSTQRNKFGVFTSTPSSKESFKLNYTSSTSFPKTLNNNNNNDDNIISKYQRTISSNFVTSTILNNKNRSEYDLKEISTDSPIIRFNIIPLTARPPYEIKSRKEKLLDSPKTQIILLNNTSSRVLPLKILTDEYEENVFSMNFKKPNQKYSNVPQDYILNDGESLKNHANILSQIESNRKKINLGNTGPYTYEKPTVHYITSKPSTAASTPTTNSENISSNNNNNVRFIINNETFKTPENRTTSYNTNFNLILNESKDPNTNITINNEIYSTSTLQSQEDNIINPLSILNNPNILYTSPSTLLQPQPFSFSQTQENPSTISSVHETNSAGVPHLQIFTVSTSSPFSNSGRTPDPTLPTPFVTIPDYAKSSKLVNENVNNMINSLMKVVKNYNSDPNNPALNTPRPGLIVPPSVGPDTLHTLAIYFASALENMTTSNFSTLDVDDFEEGSTSHINNEKLIKAFLTQMTRENYESLFSTSREEGTTESIATLTTESLNNEENDLLQENSNGLVDDLTVRQLARVFTEALSFYLDDPEAFKKVLHEVRPKEPPVTENNSDLNEADDDEVLNYSDSDLKFDHSHLSTRPTGIPITPTWGFIVAFNNSSNNYNKDMGNTNSLSNEQENFQSADSQSFVSQFNKISQQQKNEVLSKDSSKNKDYTANPLKIETNTNGDNALPSDHWTTSQDVTKLWQTALFINPAVLNNNFNTTNTDIDSFELDTASTKYFPDETSSEEVSLENTIYGNDKDIEYQLEKLPTSELNLTEVHKMLSNFMNSNKSEKLDRILNELNVTKDEFLDKMEEVETNPVNRRLILLLINECNTDENSNKKNNSSESYKSDDLKLIKSDEKTLLNSGDIDLFKEGVEYENTPKTTFNDNNEEFTESSVYKNIVDPTIKDGSEDSRALELLNSLYVIASKYGK